MTLRIIDTFSGIGGFSLAARWLGGFQTVQFVEWEPYCQRILAQHFPGIPIHGDITTFFPAAGAADVVCGGFPCQDISTAGKQAGIKQGTRSGLFYELMRVVRAVRPRYVVLENVSAILANGLDTVLGELAEAGFDAEWACVPASAVGACHQRDRWWLVAYASSARSKIISSGAAVHSFRPKEVQELRTGRVVSSTELARLGASGGSDLSNATDPNGQRQQEQHLATVADRPRWPRWGNAPRSLNPDWRSYLSEPVLCRGDDGLSGRVDRLKALGNAVVPQVAMIPLQRVLDLHHSHP